MDKIDWAKAPAGYPVWIEDISGNKLNGSGWHREEDDCEEGRWVDANERFWPKGCEARGKIIVHRKPIEWTGTGLPPVGTVCEFNVDDDEWQTCEVIAHKDGYAVCWIHVNKVFTTSGTAVRPIRTQEQIEAQEREKAINHFAAILYRDVGMDRRDAELLWNKGYRKQVEPK